MRIERSVPANRRASFRRAVTSILFASSTLLIASSASAQPTKATDWEGTRPIVPASQAPAPLDAATLARLTASAGPAPITGSTGADGAWQRVAPPLGVGNAEPRVIFDPVGDRLIAFGGFDTEFGYQSQTAAFQLPGGTWSTLATAGAPPSGREYHGLVYDPAGQRMIVFGGWADSLLGDVWQLTLTGTPTWSQLAPEGTPPTPRAGMGAIYDAVGQRMIVFGGYDGLHAPSGCENDVWALALTGTPAWTQLSPSGAAPTPRFGASAVYDPSGPALLLFAGVDGNLNNDLWRLSLDGSPTWTQPSPSGQPPSPRAEQAAVFDPASGRLAVFGGYDAYSVLSDLIVLDLSTSTPQWRSTNPQPPIVARWGAGAALANDGRMYVYGGRDVRWKALADVWAVSVATPVAWETFELLLPPRLQEVMVLDTKRDRLIAFGGTDGQYRNDTYAHSLASGRGWEPLAASGTLPPARRLHTGIYDPVGDRLIVFGGYDDQLLGDLWELTFSNPTRWSPLLPSGDGPSPRGGHVAVYDPVGHRMIVFGGYDGVTPPANRIGDTWALSLDGSPAWTRLDTGPGPSGRSSATAVYDAQNHAMVVFGGTDPDFLNETWSLSLDGSPTWSLISPGGTLPGAREEQTAAYDSKRDRMVIFGGYNSWIVNYGDLLSLDLGASVWSGLNPIGTGPSARWGAKAIYDPNRDAMWLYGGWDYTYERDLWLLQWTDPPSSGLIATTSATVGSGEARLEWLSPGPVRNVATVERTADGISWTRVGSAIPSQSGQLVFVDGTVLPDQTRAWRVRIDAAGKSLASDPVWLTAPSLAGVESPTAEFAVRPAGRASTPGAVAVACSMPRAGTARVDLLDVSGRLLDSRQVALSAGVQRIELGQGLHAGLFFVRLSGPPGVARTKVLMLR